MAATLSLEMQRFAESGLPVLTNITPTHSVCAGAQQSCVTGAGSSGVVRPQQEGRVGVTSLCSPTLHNAADES